MLGGGAEAGAGGEPDAETWGENRKGGGKSSPQELDIKPGKHYSNIRSKETILY